MNSAYLAAQYAVRRWDDRWCDYIHDKRWSRWDWTWMAGPEEFAKRALCFLFRRHEPIADQCGRPEHDACAFCGASTPGQAPRASHTA